MNCPRFNEMQSMFKDKRNQSTKSKLTTKVKTIITSINMVDVNVTTHNMTSEEQVFKDRKLKKNKFAIDWEVEEKLKKSMVETIQQMHVVNLPPDLPTPSIEEWTANWARMPSPAKPANPTKL
jgi:hypothetical protein